MDLQVSNTSPAEGGAAVVLTCKATTTDTGLTYEWSRGSDVIDGETGETFTLNSVRANSGTYTCKVTTANPLVKISSERTVTFLCKYH